MDVTEFEIAAITQDVWRAFVGLEVDGPVSPEPPREPPFCAAEVDISGPWTGRVLLECSPVLAGEAAAQVFEVDAENVDGPMMGELMAELANQIGGNLKSLLPQGCTLSLPKQFVGRAAVAAANEALASVGAPAANRVCFERDGHRFDVAVVGHT